MPGYQSKCHYQYLILIPYVVLLLPIPYLHTTIALVNISVAKSQNTAILTSLTINIAHGDR